MSQSPYPEIQIELEVPEEAAHHGCQVNDVGGPVLLKEGLRLRSVPGGKKSRPRWRGTTAPPGAPPARRPSRLRACSSVPRWPWAAPQAFMRLTQPPWSQDRKPSEKTAASQQGRRMAPKHVSGDVSPAPTDPFLRGSQQKAGSATSWKSTRAPCRHHLRVPQELEVGSGWQPSRQAPGH